MHIRPVRQTTAVQEKRRPSIQKSTVSNTSAVATTSTSKVIGMKTITTTCNISETEVSANINSSKDQVKVMTESMSKLD